MKRTIGMLFGMMAVICAAAPAYAQDAGKVGIEMSTGNALGIVWHATDKVAIRPEVTFGRATSDSTVGNTTTTTTRTQWGGAVSALFYVAKMDNLHTYVAPRFDFTRTKLKTATESTAKEYAVSGSFGAQYNLSPRFHVFGEFGLEYGWVPEETTGATKVKVNSFGTRSAVGVAFIF